MAKNPQQPAPVDPLASVAVAAPSETPAAQEPAASATPAPKKPAGPPPPPAAKPKSYRVVEAVPRISVNGHITSFSKGAVLSDLGYNIEKLKAQGVKLELVEE